jgi:hypothetical protein
MKKVLLMENNLITVVHSMINEAEVFIPKFKTLVN